MAELRAPRLTENRLNDLEVAIADLKDSVEYLDGVVKGAANEKLRKRLAEKRDALERSWQWIEGKVAAERNRRD